MYISSVYISSTNRDWFCINCRQEMHRLAISTEIFSDGHKLRGFQTGQTGPRGTQRPKPVGHLIKQQGL